MPNQDVFVPTERSDCGVACVAFVANALNHRVELEPLREALRCSSRGATVRDIVRWADQLRLHAKVLRVDLADIANLKAPAVLHWNFDHFVVLIGHSRSGYRIYDPDSGERKVGLAELDRMFTGIAIEFERQETFRPITLASPGLKLGQLWPWRSAHVSAYGLILALTVALQAAALLMPLFSKWVMDEVVPRTDSQLLFNLLLSFLAVAVASTLAMLGRSALTLLVGKQTASAMVGGLVRRMLDVRPEWFATRHIGDVVSRFSSTMQIQSFVLGFGLASVIDGLVVLIATAILFTISVPLALLVLAAFLTCVAASVLVGKQVRRWEHRKLTDQANQTTVFMETIRNIVQIKLRNAESIRWSVWNDTFDTMLQSETKAAWITASLEAAIYAISTIGAVILVFVGAHLVMSDAISQGTLLAFLMYYYLTVGSTQRIGRAIHALALLGVHLDRIAVLVSAPVETETPGTTFQDRLGPSTGIAISLEGVSYSPPGNRDSLLRRIDLRIPAGEFVAIQGRTGAGKTTLLKAMLGLITLNSGEVKIAGYDMHNAAARRAARARIGVVMQEDYLMSGTIAENIRFFAMDVDDAGLHEVARIACIHDEVMRMPMQYATQVGEMGANLSGGQTQRILLARALYCSPEILFVDEGTAHVDVATERAINEKLSALKITRVVISHRTQVFEYADRVLTLDGGELVQVTPDHSTSRQTDQPLTASAAE